MSRPGLPGFVGRCAELDQLGETLTLVDADTAAVVAVEGIGGVGKTALVRQFLRLHPTVMSLWASGEESESDLEFGVADQVGHTLPGYEPMGSRADPFVVGGRLLAGLGSFEHDRPVVLVVDDLHWVDGASARALLFLLRRLHRDRVMVVLTVRPRGANHLGSGWRRLLTDPARCRVLRLDGFDAGEVGQLAAATGRSLSPAAGERLHEHTRGNPLHVSALLAELPVAVLRDEGVPLPAPHSYAATVLARLARLPRPARDLVAAAAVLGVRAPIRQVRALAPVEDSGFVDLVDEVLAAGLMDLSPADELVFPHPLMRAAVHDDLPSAARRRLHAEAAGLVDPARSFEHRLAAADRGVDGQLAADLMTAALERRDSGALLGAARWFVAASRVSSDSAMSDECLFAAVELMLMCGDIDGVSAQRDAVRARPDTSARRYIEALMKTASGHFREPVNDLLEVRAAVGDGDPGLSGRCAAALAYLAGVGCDYAAAVHWAEVARREAPSVPMAATLSTQALAWAYANTGRAHEALALLAPARDDVLTPEPFEPDLLVIRAAVRTWTGDLDGAMQDLRGVVRLANTGYPPTDMCLAYAIMAEVEYRSGHWPAAVQHVHLAVSLGRDLDHPWYLGYAHCVAGAVYAARGDVERAGRHAADAVENCALTNVSPVVHAYGDLARGHAAWAAQDWEAVVAALGPWRRGPAAVVDHPNLASWRLRLCEAYVRRGELAAAERLIDDARRRTPAGPRPVGEGVELDRLTALLWRARGRPRAALEIYRRRPRPVSAPFELARLDLDHGTCLLEQGHDAQALRLIGEARERFVALGSARFAAACEEILTRCGEPAAAADPPVEALAGLTTREQVVAQLVADGLTNREVAAELFVSVKAVEYHLRNIFGKLGIESRRQLRDVVDPVRAAVRRAAAAGRRRPASARTDSVGAGRGGRS